MDNENTRPELSAVREQWVGVEFDWTTFEMSAESMVAWAKACGETDPRFVDPSHSDLDRKSTRLNSSHSQQSRMPSSA